MLTRAAAQRQIPPEIKALGKRNRALPQGERIEVAGSLGDYQAAGTAETASVGVEDALYWPDEAELRCNRAVASAVCCHVDVALKLIAAGTCIARECDERQRFSFTRLLLSPGTSQSLRGIPLFDPADVRPNFNESGGRYWQYAPPARCKDQPCLQQGRINQRQRNHVARWNGRLARPAELKADAAVDAGECLHHFDRIGDEARIEIKRGLGQHLLDQGAPCQGRVGERQR